MDLLTVAHHDNGVDGQLNRHSVIRTRNLDVVAVFVNEVHHRTHHVGGSRLRTLALGTGGGALRVDDDHRAQARDFVDLIHHGHILDHIFEANGTGVFGHDRQGHRIKRRELLTCFDFAAETAQQRGAVGNLMAFTFTARLSVVDNDFTGTRNHDKFAVAVGHITHGIREGHQTGVLGFHAACHGGTRSGTTDVERTHGELSTRFTDGLSGDHTDSFAGVDQRPAAEIAAVALGAQAVAGFASQRRTHLDHINAFGIDLVADLFVDERTASHNHVVLHVEDVFSGHAAKDTVTQGLNDFTAFHESAHFNAVGRAAIIFEHHQILRHVNETTCQITGVSGLQSRIGQTLTSTVSRHEVLQNVQTFAEVRGNRRFNNRAVGLGHQTTHTGNLTNLSCRTASTGVSHHVDGIERFLAHLFTMAVDDRFARELLHHHLADFVSRTAPDVDHLVVAFALGHKTGGVLLFDRLDFVFSRAHQLELLLRHGHVADANRDAGACSQTIAVVLELVGEDHRRAQTATAVAHVDQTSDFLLLERAVEFGKTHTLRQNFREKRTTDSRFITLDDRSELVAAFNLLKFADANRATRLQGNLACVQSTLHFSRIGKEDAFTRCIDAFAGGIVQTEHHVLRRHDGRVAVRREEHVVRRKHQATGFELSFKRQRHVHSHLVTVEVGVEGRANKRMQLDGLAFNELRLKSLNAEAVQGRRTVEHHGMLVNHFFEDVPNDGFLIVHHLLGALDRGRQTALFELVEDEGLKEFKRHQLGQAALM